MNDVTTWQYDASVARLRSLCQQVREHGAAAIEELRQAHEALTADSRRKKDRQWPDRTFSTYCRDAGISTRTGYRWLAAYFPDYYATLRIVPSGTIPPADGYPEDLAAPMADVEVLFGRLLHALQVHNLDSVVALDDALNLTVLNLLSKAGTLLRESNSYDGVASFCRVSNRLCNVLVEKKLRFERALGECLDMLQEHPDALAVLERNTGRRTDG